MKKFYKNLLKLFFVVLVAGFLVAVGIFLLVGERPTYSGSEKRKLTEKPEFSFVSLVSGKYFADLHDYYNDTVPERESFKEIGANFLTRFKGVSPGGIIIYDPVVAKPTEEPYDPEKDNYTQRPITTPVPFEFPTDDIDGTELPATAEPTPFGTAGPGESETPVNGTPVPTATATPVPTPTSAPDPTPDVTSKPTPTSGQGEVIEYPDDGAILYGDRGMEIYGGSRNAMKRYVATLEYIKDKCPSVNVYSITAPLSSAFYMPPSYKSNEKEQYDDLVYLESLFASGKVKCVDVYNALKEHKDENIYLRTDHHWTYLGAYYAMREFAKAAGVPFTDLSEYTAKTRSGFVGSMYSYFGMKALASMPEDFTYYLFPDYKTNVKVYYFDATNFSRIEGISGPYFEDLGTTQCYSIAMYYDHVLSISVTKAGTGRNLLIIKDSFGNPTPSFLFGSFDKIVMIDPRYYTMDVYQLIKDQNITDVLGLANIFSHTSPGFVKYYEDVAQNR